MHVVLACVLLVGPDAWANGQSTHVWITEHAKTHLPSGELQRVVTDPALQDALINGAMFPDGGYPLGDDYAEIAHWEPFQNNYRDWISSTYEAPWPDEAMLHIAFLLGMASHGIADQVFDSLFMERSRQEDADGGWGDHFDLATDVVMMQRVGKMTPPEHWLPSEPLIDIYRAQFDHEVTEATLEEGQSLLRFAITSVGLLSESPESVAGYEGDFPWAASALDDPDQPGSPPCEGEVLALYWQSVWERLHDRDDAVGLVLSTFPEDGGDSHPTTAGLVENRITVVFGEAIRQDSLGDQFVLTDEEGAVVPTDAWLFYRDMSHVVHLAPLEDLAEDATYSVEIGSGLETIDGRVSVGGTAFSFSTAVPPVVSDTGDATEGDPSAADSGASSDGGPTGSDTGSSAPSAEKAEPGGGGCSGCAVGQRTMALPWLCSLVMVLVRRRSRWAGGGAHLVPSVRGRITHAALAAGAQSPASLVRVMDRGGSGTAGALLGCCGRPYAAGP